MNIITEYIQDLKTEFKGYNGSSLVKDLMAGVTVAAVALPLALAFGVASGADAASGLITAIIAGFVMSIFAGGFYQISGPTGAMSAILITLVARCGMQGVFAATVLAGIMLALAGIFHLGRLTAFIPMPVITGFTSGIAIIIALGQVDNFFGVKSQGDNAIAKLASYGTLGFSPNIAALGIGLLVVGIMIIFPKKWAAVFPSSLASIIITTVIAIILNLNIPSVGEIPQTLFPDNRFLLASLGTVDFSQIIAPAFSIAMLGMIESLLCGASAGRMTGTKLKSDRELVAQGIGNILVPFFGGVPATAAIARTSVAIKSGAKTRLVGIFHSLGLLASMFLLAPVMSRIPMSALAGVLMVTAFRMNDWDSIKMFFKGHFKGPIAKYLVTMAATVVFDLSAAIALGIAVALVILVARLSKLDIIYDKVDPSRLDETDDRLIKCWQKTIVAYISGPLIFANTDCLDEIPTQLDGADTLILSMRGVSMLDISGGQALIEMLAALKKDGVTVKMCGISPTVRDMMNRTGVTDILGEQNYFWSATTALTSL